MGSGGAESFSLPAKEPAFIRFSFNISAGIKSAPFRLFMRLILFYAVPREEKRGEEDLIWIFLKTRLFGPSP